MLCGKGSHNDRSGAIDALKTILRSPCSALTDQGWGLSHTDIVSWYSWDLARGGTRGGINTCPSFISCFRASNSLPFTIRNHYLDHPLGPRVGNKASHSPKQGITTLWRTWVHTSGFKSPMLGNNTGEIDPYGEPSVNGPHWIAILRCNSLCYPVFSYRLSPKMQQYLT